MSTVPPASEAPPLFMQPRGLTVLFLTQMWETLSCYGMRALLVYYMTQQLLFGQQKASMIYGVYTAMVFFTPIIGGVISNYWLGHRRAVLIGSSIMALWAATGIDHQTDGFLIPMTWFQALNPRCSSSCSRRSCWCGGRSARSTVARRGRCDAWRRARSASPSAWPGLRRAVGTAVEPA